MSVTDSVGARAGLWRRVFAISIDSLIVSALIQLLVVVLFAATSGRIQVRGDLAYASCSPLANVPDDLAPPPPAGSTLARDCKIYFLGQTARILQVGRVAGNGEVEDAASRSYMLDRDGHVIQGISADWMVVLALIVYLFVMEAWSGATLGSRAMGIRVVDVASPMRMSVPLRKVVARYLVIGLGILPILLALLFSFGPYASFGELARAASQLGQEIEPIRQTGSHALRWHPLFAEYVLSLSGRLADDTGSSGVIGWLLDAGDAVMIGWLVFLAVQIARRKDPLYDKLAGTAVLRTR